MPFNTVIRRRNCLRLFFHAFFTYCLIFDRYLVLLLFMLLLLLLFFCASLFQH
jgi:hypothetical protein